MVISSNLKEDFFDKISNKHILVMAMNGVDSVCTFKIVKKILKNHNILFSYSFVKTKSELKTSFMKYGLIENVLLINCGCGFDIIEYLDISDLDNRVIYLLDSQRPIHINNFYNSKQVKILTLQEQFDNVPEFEDVFADDDLESIDSDDEEINVPKRKKYNDDYLEARIKKREWKKQREEIMFDYESYSYHGTSSSLVAYHLSTLIHQDSLELLWSAIVGHTSQLLLNFINRQLYCEYMDLILSYLSKLMASRKETRKTSLQEISIQHTEDLVLWLYRHWSLNEAINFTPATMTTFMLCKVRDTRLKEFLAYIGIPQSESKKIFSSMKLELKNEIVSLFKTYHKKFNISHDDLFLPSFVANCGYNVKLSAVDTVFIIAAMMDDLEDKAEFNEKFLNCVDFLTISDHHQICDGLSLAKEYVTALNKFAKAVVEAREVITFGPFLQVTLKKIAPPILHGSIMQFLLARYILEATSSVIPRLGKARDTRLLPLIMCTESMEKDDTIKLYGVPPLVNDKGKNVFGKVFETVLVACNNKIEQDSIDVNKIEIRTSDKLRVFHKISALLTE